MHLDFVIGEIQTVDVANGIMVVRDTTEKQKGKGINFLVYMGIPGSANGVAACQLYTPGTSVLCVRDPNSAAIGYVVCPINRIMADKARGINDALFYGNFSDDEIAVGSTTVRKALSYCISSTLNEHRECRGTGTNPDQFAGDYAITDINGLVGLFLGRYLLQLRGSPLAYIEASGLDDSITELASQHRIYTPTSEIFSERGITGTNVALRGYNTFGHITAPTNVTNAATSIDSMENAIAEEQLPFYQLQEISGACVNGRDRLTIRMPSTDPKTYTHKGSSPLVLSNRHDSVSGELIDGSAFGKMSLKSYKLKGVLQHITDSEPVGQRGIDLRMHASFGVSGVKPDTVSDDDLTRDAAINKCLPYNGALPEYITHPNHDYQAWFDPDRGATGTAVSTYVLGDMFSPEKLSKSSPIGGATQSAQYGMPPKLEVKDPVTGKLYTYFKSESFISQEPNGDILISDGYGSEIRMSRGNIYISPALDCHIRPGRDMDVMAGRYQSYNSQNTCTINTTGAAYIRANKDLRLAGAMEGKSTGKWRSSPYNVTLEHGGYPTSTGGIVIKSNNLLSMTGNNLYIGRNSGEGTGKTITEPSVSKGSIILDAGTNGILASRAHDITNYSLSTMVLCTEKAALELGHDLSMIAPDMCISTGYMNLGPNEDGVWNIDLPSQFGHDGQLVLTCPTELNIAHVSGNYFGVGTIWTNDSVRVGYLVQSKYVVCQGADLEGQGPPDLELSKPKFVDQGVMVKSVVDKISISVYCDDYVHTGAFYFPSYAVDTKTVVPGMRWQSYNKWAEQNLKWEQGTWVEEFIDGPDGAKTACYPGATCWNDVMISYPGYEKKPIKTSYIINTTNKQNGTNR